MKVSLLQRNDLSPSRMLSWKREMQLVVRPTVIVTTVSNEGIPNAALKTNFMILKALESVAFHCFPFHDTYRNILDTHEFIVNLPSEDIAEKAMATAVDFPHNVNELEEVGLTAIPSEKVAPPRIGECRLHMECRLRWCRETIIVGDVVAASADEDLIEGSYEEKQKKVKQILFLGGWKYALVGDVKDVPHEMHDRLVERHPYRKGDAEGGNQNPILVNSLFTNSSIL